MQVLVILTVLSVFTGLTTWQGVSYYNKTQRTHKQATQPTSKLTPKPSPVPTQPCVLLGCGLTVGCQTDQGKYSGSCNWDTAVCVSTSDCKNSTEILGISEGQTSSTTNSTEGTEIIYLNAGRVVYCRSEGANEVRRSYDESRRLLRAWTDCGYGGIQDKLDCLDRCQSNYNNCKAGIDLCMDIEYSCENSCKQGSVLSPCESLKEASQNMSTRVDSLVAQYCQQSKN